MKILNGTNEPKCRLMKEK
jgi:hypothetical protein